MSEEISDSFTKVRSFLNSIIRHNLMRHSSGFLNFLFIHDKIFIQIFVRFLRLTGTESEPKISVLKQN